VDISHPNYEEQIGIVNDTLTEIGAADKPTILVFNKIDKFEVEPETKKKSRTIGKLFMVRILGKKSQKIKLQEFRKLQSF
jgi:50S ribosomal subunit-associated GTPase HflX